MRLDLPNRKIEGCWLHGSIVAASVKEKQNQRAQTLYELHKLEIPKQIAFMSRKKVKSLEVPVKREETRTQRDSLRMKIKARRSEEAEDKMKLHHESEREEKEKLRALELGKSEGAKEREALLQKKEIYQGGLKRGEGVVG